jgi:Colicin V production protein.
VNWLLIIVVAILAIFALKGRKDGFIKTIFSICSLLLALVLAYNVQPYVSKALQNNDKVKGYVTEKMDDAIHLNKKEKAKHIDKGVTGQNNIINSLHLPKSLKKSLVDNNNSEVYKAFAVHSFKDYISNYLALMVINAFSFVVVFVLVWVILFLISTTLNVLSHLPLINGLNKTAGLLVGLLKGLGVVWVLCIVLTVFSSTKIGQTLYGYINSSFLLSSIYDNNILLQAITNIAKVLF